MKTTKLLVVFFVAAAFIFTISQNNGHTEMTVYDNDGQFLGFFVDEGKVYNDSHASFVSFSLSTGDISTSDLYFESPDCSGSPYIRTNPNKIVRHDDKYYKTDNVPSNENNFYSVITHQYLTCHTFQNSVEYLAVPAQEIEPPYDLPVALPLSIVFEPTKPGKWNK